MSDDKAENIVGTGPEDGPLQISATEDGPTAPGWLEPEVDKAFATLGLPADRLRSLRDSYIDCLASVPRSQDLDVAHDACRQGLLAALKAAVPLDDEKQQAFRQTLEALEARLTADL